MAAASRFDTSLEMALDPVAFARAVGIEADPAQARLLRSTSKRILLCCTRQWGKSTTTALRAAHRAIYRPGSLVLCVSPTDRQSGLLFDKVIEYMRKAPDSPRRVEDNKRSARLANGSRIVSLPGSADTIRGYSAPDMVLVDEAAFCEDALFGAVSPMLAVSGGELALLSSPYGKRGKYYEAWEASYGKEGDWECLRVPATECARISPDFLERERREMPEWLYRQEYGCEFVETLDSVFTHDQVQGALEDGEVLFG